MGDLAIVIVSFNTRDATLACIDTVVSYCPQGIVVVDNASADGTVSAISERFPEVTLLDNATNVGFSAACNRGWRCTTARRILFLNSDARLAPGTLSRLLDLLDAHPAVGIVGPRIIDATGRIEVSTGRDLDILTELAQRRLVRGVALGRGKAIAAATAQHSRERDVDWVSGACLLARREALEAVSGFDQGFFLYEEDADLCLRARQAGWRVLFSPALTVTHERGASMAGVPGLARLAYHRSHLRYYRKHRGSFACLVLRCLLLTRACAAWVHGQSQEARALLATATDRAAL